MLAWRLEHTVVRSIIKTIFPFLFYISLVALRRAEKGGGGSIREPTTTVVYVWISKIAVVAVLVVNMLFIYDLSNSPASPSHANSHLPLARIGTAHALPHCPDVILPSRNILAEIEESRNSYYCMYYPSFESSSRILAEIYWSLALDPWSLAPTSSLATRRYLARPRARVCELLLLLNYFLEQRSTWCVYSSVLESLYVST